MRSDERVSLDLDRLGMFGRPDRAWEVWREFQGDGPWAVYHPDVRDESMPNEGYFATWQEAMDFIWEYEQAKDWDRGMRMLDYLEATPPVATFHRDTGELKYKETVFQGAGVTHRFLTLDQA